MIAEKDCTLRAEVGGYFELDLPDYGDLYDDVIKFQSARAAVRAVLESNKITHVMMPAYICDSIIKSATDAGVVVETYELDCNLYPQNLPEVLPDQTVVIYVNYFGLCDKNIIKLLQKIPSNQLIIDNSQALFSHSNNDVLGIIYSPRKFVGLPDGGLLKASPLLKVSIPTVEDIGSFNRISYLLTRMAYSAREGYGGFNEARNSLSDNSPLGMSRLTQRLMRSVNWGQVIKRRRDNYKVMANIMDERNNYSWNLGDTQVPLCYPFVIKNFNVNELRSSLASQNIFTATYWPDALPRIEKTSIEATLINNTLFLPIDQRIESCDVENVAKTVLKLIGN